MTLRPRLAPLGLALGALLVFSPPPLAAQAERSPTAAPAEDGKAPEKGRTAPEEKPKEEKPSVTHHEMRIDGRPFRYMATAGYMAMKDEAGKHKANVFYVAYAREGGSSRRPITYTFNGGPGSSSVWLHMGAVGPRRVVMADDGQPLPPPYRLVDNEASWLAFTDLVFIDPVTTGYSRPAPGEKPEQFHGVEEDVQWVGDFIRLWTTRNARWASPKFLAGESYGTTRAAGLSGYLQERHGMYLNGIVLISSILNFQTADFNIGNDLPFVTFLPTYTTTAWYYKKLAPELLANFQKTVDEARQFASTEYAQALMKGARLPDAERKAIVQKMARLTGLSPAFLEACDLRVTLPRFTKELLRDQHRTVGRLDSRFQGIDRDSGGERSDYDPSMAAIRGPYGSTVNDYIRTELKYENDLPYELLTGRVRPWNYGNAQNRYVNVAETLRDAMSQNQALKVFVGAGYYDFATPFFAAEYTIDHLSLDPALRKNVTLQHYEAGHMMYIHKPSLLKLTADVAAFYGSAGGRELSVER
ncbi:MAG: peptidase S10 [Acidobacteria bacterium]|nr:peptidase S10 [Acidobacteriota bacterium]MCA1609567.1 peptidase S10 [Acidobacteriota bacterium]